MRPQTITLFGLALLTALSLSTLPARADTSYPMVCKAGTGMAATVRPGGTVTLGFVPAATAASDAPPGAGQCTWLDRPLNGAEPHRLRATTPDFGHYLVDAMFNGGTFYVHVYNDGAGSMVVTRIGP